MSIRHLISLAHLGAEDLACLVVRSVDFAKMNGRGTKPLSGEIVGIYFTKPSTRTRTSYTVAALKLGAQTVTYGADDLQITTGETIGDTVRVLSDYINALVIRTNGAFEEIATWPDQDEIAIVNAMSANEHPPRQSPTFRQSKRHWEGCRTCTCYTSARATTQPPH
jgi:ornithine carbamoyltransferase